MSWWITVSSRLTICTSLFADDKFLPISDVSVAGGAIIFDLSPKFKVENWFVIINILQCFWYKSEFEYNIYQIWQIFSYDEFTLIHVIITYLYLHVDYDELALLSSENICLRKWSSSTANLHPSELRMCQSSNVFSYYYPKKEEIFFLTMVTTGGKIYLILI